MLTVSEMHPSDIFLARESTLVLYYWDGTKWTQEPTSTLDMVARTVSATPNHFSYWAVLGEPRTDLQKVYLPVAARNGW